MSPSNDERCRFDPFYLDLDKRVLLRGGEEQKLRLQAVEVLCVFVQHPGELLTYEDLMERAWGKNTHVSRHTLIETVREVRKALGDEAEPHKFIKSEPKRGYRFIALPDESAEAKPAAIQFGESPQPQKTRWGPVDGKPAGICIDSCVTGIFIPWSELKAELEERLLLQVRTVPIRCTVSLGEFRGRKDWIVRVLNPGGEEIANVWFGPDPYNGWAWDGLVRIGISEELGVPAPVVWQIFQRYSDGSYRRIKVC